MFGELVDLVPAELPFGAVQWWPSEPLSHPRSAAVAELACAAGIDDVAGRWPDVGRVATLSAGPHLVAVAVLERVAAEGFWAPEVAFGGELWHLAMVSTDGRWRRRGAATMLVD